MNNIERFVRKHGKAITFIGGALAAFAATKPKESPKKRHKKKSNVVAVYREYIVIEK